MNSHAATLLASLESRCGLPGDAWGRVRGLLEQHAESAFGRVHGFAGIRTVEDFREAVPVLNYYNYSS